MEIRNDRLILEPIEILMIDTERKSLSFGQKIPSKTVSTFSQFQQIVEMLKHPNTIEDEKLRKRFEGIKVVIVDSFSRLTFRLYQQLKEHGYKGYAIWDEYKMVLQYLLLDFQCPNKLFVYIGHDMVIQDNDCIDRKTVAVDGQLKGKIEEFFTNVFYSTFNRAVAERSQAYQFHTNTDGYNSAKTAIGLFDELTIPNNLGLICGKLINYYSKGNLDEFNISPILIYGKSSTGKTASIRGLLDENI